MVGLITALKNKGDIMKYYYGIKNSEGISLKQFIDVTKAHVIMLEEQGILSGSEKISIFNGLKEHIITVKMVCVIGL